MVTHQLQVERRTAKAHRPKTNAVPLDHATNQNSVTGVDVRLCVFVCSDIEGVSRVKWRHLLNDVVTTCFHVADVVLPVVSHSSPEGNIPKDLSFESQGELCKVNIKVCVHASCSDMYAYVQLMSCTVIPLRHVEVHC